MVRTGCVGWGWWRATVVTDASVSSGRETAHTALIIVNAGKKMSAEITTSVLSASLAATFGCGAQRGTRHHGKQLVGSL